MTITQIIARLEPHKQMTQATLYAHLRRLKIKPLGRVRQCPQRYPDDTAKRILRELGITTKRNSRQRAA
jgi:hypothetical protein